MEKHHGHGQTKKTVWDCDSALYDSFELKSFNQQLDSAIATRSYSMPHLSNPAAPPPPPASTAPKNKPSKISKSINRLLRSLLRMRPRHGVRSRGYGDMVGGGHLYGQRANYGSLTTIPEACEKDAASSPEVSSVLAGKSMSGRFAAPAATAVRISRPTDSATASAATMTRGLLRT
ncbi:hypothetical protein Taro_015468 [Colocasia esculenta]|uniref:Uncharacterized protein n=1 Tax=Colocasia esculenta TaxID=4460 RepID=A0A843UBJ1_COLES|nr:hypothetical protein [Colocasia esculenta]